MSVYEVSICLTRSSYRDLAYAAVTLVNAMGSLLAIGDRLGHSVHTLTSMPLVAAPVVTVASGSVNRIIDGSNFGGSGRRGLEVSQRSDLILGNPTFVAAEPFATFVDAVLTLLAGLDHLRHSVLAMAPEPVAAAPV